MKNAFDLEIDGFASQLKAIRPRSAALIFVSAVERWLPVYEDFSSECGWGDVRRFREVADQLWRILSQEQIPVTGAMKKALLESPLALAPDGEEFNNVHSTIAQDICSLLEASVHWTLGENPRDVYSIEFMFTPIRLAYLFAVSGDIDASGAPDEAALMKGLILDGRFQRERTSFVKSIADLMLPCDQLRTRAVEASWRIKHLLG